MQAYIEAIDTYLKAHPVSMRCPNVDGILDMLYCCYRQQKGDTADIKQLFCELDTVLEKLTLQENDRVFDLVCHLCGAHKQDAFREGLQVGFRLYNELHVK